MCGYVVVWDGFGKYILLFKYERLFSDSLLLHLDALVKSFSLLLKCN